MEPTWSTHSPSPIPYGLVTPTPQSSREIDPWTEDRLACAAARRDELEQLGNQIAEIAARITVATHELLVLLGEFDAREGWGEGFKSCAHWLSWRTGLALGAAREKVRVARALPDLPKISATMRRGEISYSKVRALTRVATGENEEELLEFAMAGTAAHVERLVRAWRRLDGIDGIEGETERERRRAEERQLQVYPDEDGMVTVRGRLEPEAGAVLMRALEAAGEVLYTEGRATDVTSGEPIPAAQRRADALGLVAEVALGGGKLGDAGMPRGEGAGEDSVGDAGVAGDKVEEDVTGDAVVEGGMMEEAENATADASHEGSSCGCSSSSEDERRSRGNVSAADGNSTPPLDLGTRGDRYQVVVHIDAAVLADPSAPGQSVLEGIGGVSAETSRRLACDASLVPMIHDTDGGILDVGRRTRAVSPAMRRALTHRDGGCRFPGCDAKLCDAHHIEHWAEGGETKLDNLVLLCRRHHRAVHEEGYRIEVDGGGQLQFLLPNGRPLPLAPGISHRGLMALEDWLAKQGHEIDPEAIFPRWGGEGMDLRYAIEGLRRGEGRGGTGPSASSR